MPTHPVVHSSTRARIRSTLRFAVRPADLCQFSSRQEVSADSILLVLRRILKTAFPVTAFTRHYTEDEPDATLMNAPIGSRYSPHSRQPSLLELPSTSAGSLPES